MATKQKIQFMCTECGDVFPRWEGKCGSCGQWNTLVEEKFSSEKKSAAGGGKALFRGGALGESAKPVPINKVNLLAESRGMTGIGEFDRIVGGGIVAGSVTLIGGEPGIGKSTLLLQVALAMAAEGAPSLYVSGEESLEQMRLRAGRMGAVSEHLLCLGETQVEAIGNHIEAVRPSCVIVDSIQTAWSEECGSAPGSVSQIRDSAAHLITLCKHLHVPLFLVGHVTKSGAVAGPRVLEHMVDTVLYFEGDRHHNFRILRAVKNRFGSTNEIGIFEMGREGLIEVANPSELFLQERPEGASGSVVVPALEGTRPLLVEIQALTAPNGGFGAARRSSNGLDQRRVALLIAVLEKRMGLRLFDQDVYVNIAGGVKVEEPAADLAALSAIVSSFQSAAIDQRTVVLGEVGLAGEIRSVSHLEKRLTEAARLGFTRAVCAPASKSKPPAGLKIIGVKNVAEALKALEIF
jgi:DNA repair protein RadA/Sms